MLPQRTLVDWRLPAPAGKAQPVEDAYVGLPN